MPNGRNAGRLYPGVPGDTEIVQWDEASASSRLVWKLEGSVIAPMWLDSREAAESYAKDHNMEFSVNPATEGA